MWDEYEMKLLQVSKVSYFNLLGGVARLEVRSDSRVWVLPWT